MKIVEELFLILMKNIFMEYNKLLVMKVKRKNSEVNNYGKE